MTKKSHQEQLAILIAGCEEVINQEELATKLARGKPLKIKIGFDPTAPDLHLGHLVQLNKLKEFQNLGHQVIFLVGDFTACIGDPSGKSETRPPLSPSEVTENAATYTEQAYRILDKQSTLIRYNSEWSNHLTPQDLIQLMAHYTIARLLERDDFATRYKKGQPIALHEFLYPLIQAYDSVALKADVELGGTDQTFNLLVGRKIQRDYGQESQVVMTLPLLEGIDGVKKMSKSLNNYIAFEDSPQEIYGKVMSLSDELMWHYWSTLRLCSTEELMEMKQRINEGGNPRDIKRRLAWKLTARLYSISAADTAQKAFISQFSGHALPEDIPLHRIPSFKEEGIPIARVIKEAKLTESTSEALRMLAAGAVQLNERKIEDKNLLLKKGDKYLLRVGKRRFAQVELI